MDKIESYLESLKVELQGNLTDIVCQKINFNLLKFLPKVHKELNENKEFRKRTQLWILDEETKKEMQKKEDSEGQQ